MRVWDEIPVELLCRKHLGAEHFETGTIWNVINYDMKGWRKHPEVLRWKDHQYALLLRHQKLRDEARKRGYNYKELNGLSFIHGTSMINPKPYDDQLTKLKAKKCGCCINT